MTSAAANWRDSLASLAIPPAILAAAPESPYVFSVPMFERRAALAVEATGSPSRRSALDALREGGSVLDVGCGAGAASLPLVPPATRLVGVDESPGMLEAFARAAAHVDHAVVQGRWPDVADRVEVADVVVCHHVVYNAGDLEAVAAALTSHARRRVVVEATGTHPRAWLVPLWRALHGYEMPEGPLAEDALAVLHELGYRVSVDTVASEFTLAGASREDLVAFVRRGLCLGAERDRDIAAALDRHPLPRTRVLVTMSWDPTPR